MSWVSIWNMVFQHEFVFLIPHKLNCLQSCKLDFLQLFWKLLWVGYLHGGKYHYQVQAVEQIIVCGNKMRRVWCDLWRHPYSSPACSLVLWETDVPIFTFYRNVNCFFHVLFLARLVTKLQLRGQRSVPQRYKHRKEESKDRSCFTTVLLFFPSLWYL